MANLQILSRLRYLTMAQLEIITNDKLKLPQTSIEFVSEQQKQNDAPEMAPFLSLFRFATKTDKILIFCGTVCACAMGVAIPTFAVLWGNMTDKFGNVDQMIEQAKKVMLNFIEIGLAALIAGWGTFACWMIAGQRQSISIRKEYLKSLLKQEIGWFDITNQSQLATKFTTDCFAFQGAIGEKVSTLIMTFSTLLSGFVIAFIYGWTMTLVLAASLPAIGLGGYLYSSASANKDKKQEKEYAEAGGYAQQAISAIKTVKQLNGQEYQAKKYAQSLKTVTQNSVKHGVSLGFGLGLLFFSILANYALGFWYGSQCVQGTEKCPVSINGGKVYTAGNVLIVFFSILMAGYNVSQLTPAIKKISEGRVAAARIFKLIDRQPLIKNSINSVIPSNFIGSFRFQGVSFAYPKDKHRKILNNFSLQIIAKNTAFVGESGCGKSTIFQLMMRFYDPDQGRITLDGINLKDIDLNWLRNQIGYVGQEPVLFAATIKENLLFGKETATDEQINQALRKAEAYQFVYSLKDKLDTYVGTGGGLVSGGQKQRIAIARAILKNPKILLLDQATSALDRRNEKLIQNTLNKIAEEKITITIAHRVKTIMNCEMIYVMKQGKIQEQGEFKALKRYNGADLEQQAQFQEQINQIKAQLLQSHHKIIKYQPQDKCLKEKANNQVNQIQQSKNQSQDLLLKYKDSLWIRLFAYSSDKKCILALGVTASIANGLIFPVFSIFLSKMLSVLVNFSVNPSESRSKANTYSLIYLMLAIIAFIVVIIQQTSFSYIGQHLTQQIRNQTYLKILKMPIPWFEKPKNNSGSLSARLASDCKTVNGLITTYLSVIIQSVTTLLAGVIIAFIYEWRTSLVALGLLPLMIASGAVLISVTQGFSDKTDKVYKNSSNLITESMLNIRTVTSFGSQDIIQRKYSSRLVEPQHAGIKKGLISGFLYGLTQIIMFFVFGLIFYLGCIFMKNNSLELSDVFTAIYGIVFSGMAAGNNSHFLPDAAAAKASAVNLFQILDSQDQNQLQVAQNSKLLKNIAVGNIVFKNVSFKYETRDVPVFQKLSFQIKKGEKVAFVGSSGCGKSTIFQLIQRFYNQNEGQIIIDGESIKDYDLHFLRSYFGVVSQEPVLFNETIQNNIKYNLIGASNEEIVIAADLANFNPEKQAIQVVLSHQIPRKNKIKGRFQQPLQRQVLQTQQTYKGNFKDGRGFSKNVGVKGSHISGGQKQRVAIARVILRDPSILLLDEATSALDSMNEQKVQLSLDQLMKGKTSLTIAHRINTIKNCDQIFVFHVGKIAEKGTFQALMSKKGYFYRIQKGLQMI